MHPATLPSELEAALVQFEQGGGVVHYFVFEADAEPDLHRRATLEGFERLKTQLEPFQLTLAPELMKSEIITTDQFFKALDTSAGRLESPGVYFLYRAEQLKTLKGFSTSSSGSYLKAFCDPPYGLRLTPGDAQAIFDTITWNLFDPYEDDLEIVRWSDDWSNFFEAGLEWWGAYWWTVVNRTKGLVIVVAASTTD
jgi:hypothetical protein